MTGPHAGEILPERQREILSVSMALDIQGTGSHAGSVSSKRGLQDT